MYSKTWIQPRSQFCTHNRWGPQGKVPPPTKEKRWPFKRKSGGALLLRSFAGPHLLYDLSTYPK